MKLSLRDGLAFALILVLFGLRFLFPSEAPFSHDESALQGMVEGHFRAGTWPTFGLTGSMGLHYGPVPQWIYICFRYLSGSPLAFISLYALLFSTAFFFFGGALYRQLGLKPTLLALVLVLSSPWIFIYSRLPWDNSFLVLFSAILLFLVSGENQASFLYWALLGLTVGAGISTHLMFLPISLAAFLISLQKIWRAPLHPKRKAIFIALAGFCVLLVNIPYLHYLITAGLAQVKHKEHWGTLRQTWWVFLKSTIYLGTWNLKFFFYPYEEGFSLWLPPLARKLFHLDIFSWILKLGLWLLFITAAVKRRKKYVSSLFDFALLTVFFHLLLLQYLDINIYPHYYMAIWWFPFWAVAFAFQRLTGLPQKIYSYAIAGTLITNLLFLLSLQLWNNQNAGTRGDFFPSLVGEQIGAVHEICLRAKSRGQNKIKVDLSTVRMDAGVFAFFPARDNTCTGLEFDIPSNKIDVGTPIPKNFPTTADYIVMYDDSTPYNAHLKVFDGK